MRMCDKIWACLLLAAVAWLAPGCAGRPADDSTLRVGYQKWGTYSLLKASGELERSLAEAGASVEWVEFPSGPPLLEALNSGAIDVGHAGDSPPLFAQAAGVPFVYLAASSPSPESSALLVQDGSPVREVRDLKGRSIGLVKGSSAHALVVRALERAGLGLDDARLVYLAPADARSALASGAIDAWAVWDPYLAAAEQGGTTRRLVSGRGLVSGREFYLASSEIVGQRPALVRRFLSELARVKRWASQRTAEVNRLLAEQTGIAAEAIALAESRRDRYDTRPIDGGLVEEQQALADRFTQLGLLPHPIRVRQAVHPTNLLPGD